MGAITYTKREVARRTAKKLGLKIYKVEAIVDGVFHTLQGMMSEPSRNIRIEIRNVGVFEVKPTKAKPKARNLRRGRCMRRLWRLTLILRLQLTT